MPKPPSVADLSSMIRSRRALVDEGWTERGVDDSRRQGSIRSVRRGWFVEASEWSTLRPEAQHLAHVIAVIRDSCGGGVISHESAAVVWGLPLYRCRPTRVHMTIEPGGRISSGRDVFRHVAALPREDVVIREGIRVTSLARTVFDVTRTMRVEQALVIADAAERSMIARGRAWDLDARSSWRQGLRCRIDGAAGARGIVRARRIADFADGRSESPGESVSRLQIVRLGFATPELQMPVGGPGGKTYYIDFRLPDARAFGEFDGEVKYRDEALRRGRAIEDVLLAEKAREDWVRGVTQSRFARWGSAHISSAALLGARLAAFGIRPPG